MKKIIRSVALFLSLCMCSFSLWGCFSDNSIGSILSEDGSGSSAEKMNLDQIYGVFLAGAQDYETGFVFENADKEDVVLVFDQFLYENPQFFWYGNGYECSVETRGSEKTVYFNPSVMENCESTENIEAMARELSQKVSSFTELAMEYTDPFEQLLFIHDKLIADCDYDDDAADYILDGNNDIVLTETTAYGCLVEGMAVCSGYSAAFQYITEELGYECFRVNGEGMNSNSHQWNCIFVDGDYYYIDVTWDDPSGKSEGVEVFHDYFCITTEELLITHTIDEGQFVQDCTSYDLDYYINRGLYFEEYDFDEVAKVIDSDYKKSGVCELKFSSEDELNRAVDDLFENQMIFEIDSVRDGGGSVFYIISAGGLVLTINQGN